jgi:Chaperone of endosialidase
MAATVLDPRVVLTDGVTIIDNALFQLLQDRIDALFNGVNVFTLGGLIATEGIGQHRLVAAGPGRNQLLIRNLQAGTAAFASVAVGNDTNDEALSVAALSSTYTAQSGIPVNSTVINSYLPGGLSIVNWSATSDLRLMRGTAAQLTLGPSGAGGYNAPADVGTLFVVGGDWMPPAERAEIYGVRIAPHAKGHATTNYVALLQLDGAVTLAGPTVVYQLSSLILYPPAVTAPGGVVGTACTVCIWDAPNTTGTNYALYSRAGLNVFGGQVIAGDGSLTAPSYAFISQRDLGFYRSGLNTLRLAGGGYDMVEFNAIGPGGGATTFYGAFFLVIGTNPSPANLFIDSSTNQVFRSTSSRRDKTAIAPLQVELTDLLALEPVTFAARARPEGGRIPGFIAEDVAEHFPELVEYRDGIPDGVRYDRIGAYLLAALRGLHHRVTALEATT